MPAEITFQRLYERIELISGTGDAALGKLGIMSFVSLLAEEPFGDRPKSASRVIRKFIVPVNDRMDAAARQRLKPFAPRIVDTNDGLDGARAGFLYESVMDEVLPRTGLRHQDLDDTAAVADTLGPRAAANLRHIRVACDDGRRDLLAKECGRLIASLSQRAGAPEDKSWYWDKAIELLDRLCDIGAEARYAVYGRRATAG